MSIKWMVLVLSLAVLPAVRADRADRAGLPVTEYTLKNGMKVLVYEDHSAPIVSTQIWYRVGSYDDPAGRTGISHLLEHMMFKGTRRFGPKSYDRIIEEHGGEENAFTSTHYTVFYANLSRDYYPIDLDLEADRMANLLLDSTEFERERKVVMEERRLSENEPYSPLFETFDETAFLRHPYRNPTVGWMDNIRQIRHADIVDYYHRWYNPANALAVFAGDITAGKALTMVERSFGKLKGKPVVEQPVEEPVQRGERRIEVKRDVGSPAILIGFHIPEETNEDSDVLNVVAGILFSGRTSRMYKKIVYQDQQALSCSGWVGNSKYPGEFYIFAIPRPGKDLAGLEGSIEQQLELLKTDTIGDRELARVKNQTIAGFLFSQDSDMGMGMGLAGTEIITGSYKNLETYPDRIGRVTKDRMRAVAKKYFTKDNRTVAVLIPDKEAK